jgi:hypothetical protein
VAHIPFILRPKRLSGKAMIRDLYKLPGERIGVSLARNGLRT